MTSLVWRSGLIWTKFGNMIWNSTQITAIYLKSKMEGEFQLPCCEPFFAAFFPDAVSCSARCSFRIVSDHGQCHQYNRHGSCRATFEGGTAKPCFAVPHFYLKIIKHIGEWWFSLVNLTKFGPFVMGKRWFKLTNFNMFMTYTTNLKIIGKEFPDLL